MKSLLFTAVLLVSGYAMAIDMKPKVGQFDPKQCGCETCFTNYGVCTAVNQDLLRNEPRRGVAKEKVKGRSGGTGVFGN